MLDLHLFLGQGLRLRGGVDNSGGRDQWPSGKCNVLWETFEGENFCEFRCFVPVSVSFLSDRLKAWWTVGGTSEQSKKVFSVKSIFPLIHQSFLPRKIPTIRYLEVRNNSF